MPFWKHAFLFSLNDMNQSIAGLLWPQLSEDQFTWWAQQMQILQYLQLSVWVSNGFNMFNSLAFPVCFATCATCALYDLYAIFSPREAMAMTAMIPIPSASFSILDSLLDSRAVLAFVHQRASTHKSLPESMHCGVRSHALKRLEFNSQPCLIFL